MRKRILFIVPLPPPVHGSAMMCRYIMDSRLINDTFQCDYVNLSTSRRMDEIGKRSINKIWRFVGSYFIVLGKLLIHRYDACYLAITCHGIGFLKDAPFVLLCKLFGCKVIIHQHNQGMANDVGRWPYRWLFPLVYKNTTVILLSWKLYPDVEKVVKREQVTVCPNGIPDIEIDTVSQKHHNTIPHLLFLSNLIESKGVVDLLDACKILKDNGYRFICNFVGGETNDFDARHFNEEVRKRGLDSTACFLGEGYGKHKVYQYPNSNVLMHAQGRYVNYLGRSYGKEKEQILEDSDIFIFPTFNECFPLVLLEAMRHKLAIVTTDEGGITDIVTDGENGLICKKRSPQDLASKIIFLLENPSKIVEMGACGRRVYENKFVLSQFETNIAVLLERIAGTT